MSRCRSFFYSGNLSPTFADLPDDPDGVLRPRITTPPRLLPYTEAGSAPVTGNQIINRCNFLAIDTLALFSAESFSTTCSTSASVRGSDRRV